MPFLKDNAKLLIFVFFFLPSYLVSHGAEQHETVQDQIDKFNAAQPTYKKKFDEVYVNINTQYIKHVKPIFEKKCFDCHGDTTKYPWYYALPGIKQMIDHDIKEAKEHIDMSKDFPFLSHKTPLKDLQSLRKIGLKGGMPPLRYILGHWDSRLTQDEKRLIIQWTEDSMKILEKSNND